VHGATSIHPLIEFGNRTLTGLLVIIAIAVAVLVFTDRRRSTSFRVLGLVPLIGVALQAFIGGATVLLHLNPAVVGVHLLLSMALVSASTVLVVRGGETDGRPAPLVRGDRLARELGIEPGPDLGALLARLAEAQFAGEASTPEAAVALARQLI